MQTMETLAYQLSQFNLFSWSTYSE